MRLLLLAALLAALVVVPSIPAAAQDPGVPDWAAPPSPRGPVTQAQQPPDPPPDPDPVPVNGLLALLALAGGAYAVRRLTRDDA